MRTCAVCACLGLDPCPSSGEVGLWTNLPGIIAEATYVFPAAPAGEEHVMLPVCSEHVVEIYRGRIPGVRMAWRLRLEPVAPVIA